MISSAHNYKYRYIPMISCAHHKEKLPPWFENFVEQGDSVGLVWHPVEAGEGGHLRELVSNIMKLENLFSNIKELLQI